jgi:hypothetical protein
MQPKEVLDMERECLPYARLTEKQLEKLQDAEKFLNRQPDRGPQEEEIILLAFRRQED